MLVYAKKFIDAGRLIEDDLVAEIFGIDLGELHSESHKPFTQPVRPIANEEIRTIVIEPTPKVRRAKTISATKEKPVKVLTPDRMVIRQFGLDGTFIAQYETYDDASEQTRIAKRIIQRNVCGEKKSGGGYVWRKESANTSYDQNTPLKYDGDSQKRSVCQYEYNGILVAEYESISEAARETGINIGGIRHALRGLQKQAEGYIWTYKEDKTNV